MPLWLTNIILKVLGGLAKWLGLFWLVKKYQEGKEAKRVAEIKDDQLNAANDRSRTKRSLVDKLRRDGL